MKRNNQHTDLANPSLELVVARYAEDLAWLRNIPPQISVTVYDKNPDQPYPGALRLPNVGREAHSYLQHIVSRYDALAPLSIFCQGKPFDHAFDFHQTLRNVARDGGSLVEFRWLGHIVDTDDAKGRRLFASWSKNEDGRELDMTAFHRALFGSAGPDQYTFHLGAQFIVSAAAVRGRSLEFYRRALKISTDFPDAAHGFERSWDKLFGVQGIDLNWLNGRQTVYLKPIRRLTIDPVAP